MIAEQFADAAGADPVGDSDQDGFKSVSVDLLLQLLELFIVFQNAHITRCHDADDARRLDRSGDMDSPAPLCFQDSLYDQRAQSKRHRLFGNLEFRGEFPYRGKFVAVDSPCDPLFQSCRQCRIS